MLFSHFYTDGSFVSMYVYIHATLLPMEARRGLLELLELELQTMELQSCHVGAANQTQVLYEGRQCCQLLSHLSSPN